MAERPRAASEVLGFILVFTLVLSSVTLVSIVGLDVLSNAQANEQIHNAERAFGVLADNVAKVAGGEAPRRATEMDLANAQLHTMDNVTVNVTATGGTDAAVERSVRPIRYSGQNDMSLYYEGGAVIRSDPDGDVVLREPPYVVTDERALVQIVAPQSATAIGVGSSTFRVVATAKNSTVAVEDRSGTFDRLLVNVTSPRRDAWQSILEEEGFGSCRRGTDAAGDAFVTCERSPPSGSFDRLYVTSSEVAVSLDR
jgi:hypothetical protein